MRKVSALVTLLACTTLLAGLALAATEFKREQTTVTVGSNTITVDSLVKYVDYTIGETIPVTIDYSATCNVGFGSLGLRWPIPFTPPKPVKGAVSNVTGPAGVGTTGSVTFDLQFTSLKHAGKKDFGIAHLNLVLGVDEDCNPATGDADGIDGSTTIKIEVSASTASHP